MSVTEEGSLAGLRGGHVCDYRSLLDDMPELICQFTPDTTITYVNAACARFHGGSPDELWGRRILDLVPPEYVEHTEEHMRALMSSTPSRPTLVNLTQATSLDGSTRWQEWTNTAVFDDGQVVSFIGIGRDVTSRIEAEERSRYHAEHDDLTGLLNRRMITEALDRMTNRAARGGESLGVLYLDLDRFKSVNDDFGHEAGDRVLIDVADALREATRANDLVGRLGGDEFVILVSPAEDDAIAALADRIRQAFCHMEHPVGVSIGTATSAMTTSAAALLRLADQSMYAEKAQGSSR